MSRLAPAAALGIRVKSGWGAAVLLGGSSAAPRLLDACRLGLSDPKTRESVQPYHAATGTARTDQRELRRLIALVERCSERNLAALLAGFGAAGRLPAQAAVIGSSAVDPETIGNPHIRIHALEGQLFRRVTREALTRSGIPCVLLLEQELHSRASAALGRPGEQLERELRALGRDAGGPWRAEQKSAALAAWLLLASAEGHPIAQGLRPSQ